MKILARALAAIALLFVGLTAAYAQLSAAQTWAGTAGGTATALTLNIHNVTTFNDLLGVPIRFLPSVASNGPAAIVVNLDGGTSLASTAIKRQTSNIGLAALSNGELQLGVLTEVTFDGAQFVITSPQNMTPVGGVCEFRGATAPTGCLVEDGTCFSTTGIYAPLFSVIGTTYNAGAPSACAGGQFAVPYSNGSVFAANDNQGANTASRITNAGSSCAATGSGTFCGVQNTTLVTLNLPPYTPAGAVSITNGANVWFNSGALALTNNPTNYSFSAGTITASFTGTPQGGTSTPFSRLPPLLTGVRAIKY